MDAAARSALASQLEETRREDNSWLGLSGPLPVGPGEQVPDFEHLWDSGDWTSESTMIEDGAGLMLWGDAGSSSETTGQDDVAGPMLWNENGSSSTEFGSDKGESGSELATLLDESPAELLQVAAADSGGHRSDRWLPDGHQGQLSLLGAQWTAETARDRRGDPVGRTAATTRPALAPTTSVEPQRSATWMPTQGQPAVTAWAQIVTKEETPAPAATLPTAGAQMEESRTAHPSGPRAAQNEDVEAPRPATARHLPRRHPLVGLAGKVQGATDEPLVCPLCNRGCEEHHRLGFHWGKFGYDGPPYCSRCSSVFRAHMLKQTVSASKCSRQNPCAQCIAVLSNFSNSHEEAFAAMDEAAAQSTKGKLQDTSKVKPAERDVAIEEPVGQCPHCGTEGPCKSMGRFWGKFGYTGPQYCTECSAIFRSHIVRQRSRALRHCSRDCPCRICDSILNSFEDPSPEGRKQSFERMASKRHQRPVAIGNRSAGVKSKRSAGIEIEMTVNPSEAAVGNASKKRKPSNCGGGVSVPLPLAFVGLVSVVALILLASGNLPMQTVDGSELGPVCIGSLPVDPAFPNVPIDRHCRGSVGSICEFRCQLPDYLPVGNRTCTETGVYSGGDCEVLVVPDPPHPMLPHNARVREWAYVCSEWQWICADDQSRLPSEGSYGNIDYYTWPLFSFSAVADGDGSDVSGQCAYVCAQFGTPRDSQLRTFCPVEYNQCYPSSDHPKTQYSDGRYDPNACDDFPSDSFGGHRLLGVSNPAVSSNPIELPPGPKAPISPQATCATDFNCAVSLEKARVSPTVSWQYLELLDCVLRYPTEPYPALSGGNSSTVEQLPQWTNTCAQWRWQCGNVDQLRQIPAGQGWPVGMTGSKWWPNDTSSTVQPRVECCWQCTRGFVHGVVARQASGKLDLDRLCPHEYAQCASAARSSGAYPNFTTSGNCMDVVDTALSKSSPFFKGRSAALYPPEYSNLITCVLDPNKAPPTTYDLATPV